MGENMKRILVRFSILVVLVVTGCFLYLDVPVSGAGDCAMTVYSKWMSCDNSYANTAQQYAIREQYCWMNAPSTCPNAQTEIFCAANPSTYTSCCMAASLAACDANITSTYDNRGSSYSSCMGIEGNFGNCIEQVADFCLDAQNRVSVCLSVYDGEDNSEARSTCIANSGINQCV